jgi:hypothetical protein
MARKESRSAGNKPTADRGRPPAVQTPAAKPGVSFARLLDRIRWDWLALAFALVAMAWLVTDGDWDFFPKAGFLEGFYDAQAQSLLHGRIDVPPDAIATEAFMRNGKAYGYFGPTPALMRLPLNLLLPGMYGRWGRVSMLLASVLTLAMLMLLMGRLESRFSPAAPPRWRNQLRAALILAAAIGSTNFFVSTERKVYQESIAWGSAWAFAQAVFLACYFIHPKAKWLAWSCAAALLAFLARVSSGAGPLVSLFLLEAVCLAPAVRFREFFAGFAVPRRAGLAVGATLLAAVALWAGLNYWKFGTVLTSQPIALNKQYDRERVQRVKGDLFSLYNLPITLSAYLSPAQIEFNRTFPWIFLTSGGPALAARFPSAHFDYAEPFAGLPAAMPELFLAAIAGTVLCLAGRRRELREFRAPMCGAIAGCALLFTWGVITYRYLHDMFPWLLLGSAVAVAYLPSIPGKSLRRGLAGLFLAATLYAMCVNVAFAYRWQRYACYPIRPEKRVAFTDLCSVMDTAGLKEFLWFTWHWHRYIPAASFTTGNLLIDTTRLVERDDQPVVLSQGKPPYGAEYDVDLPATGTYQIAILYAAAESRPVHLFVNGHDVKEVLGAPTGGWLPANRVWGSAGLFQLIGGANRIGLASYGPFPPIAMLRIIRVD